MAKPSYQLMAAHLAAQSDPNAPQENNTYLALRNFYNRLSAKLELFDRGQKKAYDSASNLLNAIRALLQNAASLSETAKTGNKEQTKKQLDENADVCEKFDQCLAAFKKDALTNPSFSIYKKDVKAFEDTTFDKGQAILDTAGISQQDLINEKAKEVKQEPVPAVKDQAKKEESVPVAKDQEKKEDPKANIPKIPGMPSPSAYHEYLEKLNTREELELHQRAQEYVDNYVLYADKPIEPVKWTKKEQTDANKPFDTFGLELPTQIKSWKNYRLIHLRGADPEQPDFKENLAKSIVSTFQIARPKADQDQFSVKLARSQAKQLMNLPTFKTFCDSPRMVRKYLNGDNLFQACGGLFRPFHLTDRDKGCEILQALKKMPEKMDDPENQPKEWKNLIKTLKSLDPYVNDEEQEKQMQAVYDATAAYMKGRKSVRSTEEERNQFDQSMDVLATLAKGNDFAKVAANVLVDRTNEVRDRIFHKHQPISLSNYGEDKLDQHTNQNLRRRDSLGDIELNDSPSRGSF